MPKDSGASKHALDRGEDIQINIKAAHRTVVFKPWMHADGSAAHTNMKYISSEVHVCILALELIAAMLRKDNVLPEDARAVQCGAQVCSCLYVVSVCMRVCVFWRGHIFWHSHIFLHGGRIFWHGRMISFPCTHNLASVSQLLF